MTSIIDLHIIKKAYKMKKSSLMVFDDFALEVKEGERIAVVGESGAGKSTLLNILGLMDSDFVGRYTLFGLSVKNLHNKDLARLRNQKIGFVLQESALINSLTIEDNIKLPFLYSDSSKKTYDPVEFDNMIDRIGIRPVLKKKPLECSGGERSRAVFARGIIMQPQIILADEPTASLDENNSARIMELLFQLNETLNTTIITVTHDLQIARQHDRMISIKDKA